MTFEEWKQADKTRKEIGDAAGALLVVIREDSTKDPKDVLLEWPILDEIDLGPDVKEHDERFDYFYEAVLEQVRGKGSNCTS